MRIVNRLISKFSWQANRATLFVLLIGLLFGLSSLQASGQAGSSEWVEPVNLSASGTGTRPYVVMDAGQQIHVLWQDLLEDSFVYTVGRDGEWRQPALVEVPFGTRAYFPQLTVSEPTPLYAPQLVADGAGLIHAFWIGDESELFHSSAPAGGFAEFASWAVPQSLALDVVRFEGLIDLNGRIHLAYITNGATLGISTGLLYRSSDDGGLTWTESNELYQSPYFRLLTPANAHLDMSIDGSDLYIAWDNRPRERIFLVHSPNNGLTWEEPEEIDSRQENDSLDDVSPRNILVANNNGELHLTWQAGHEGRGCTQIHQWLDNSGVEWQTAPNFWGTFQGCPTNIQFLTGEPGLFLLVEIPEAKYLLVWGDSEWYDPHLEPSLSTSIDEDVFRSVNYNCGQSVLVAGDQLIVVSCGEGTGQDVWLTSRSLTTLIESQQETPVWLEPTPLEGGAELISAPSLIVAGENNLHLFWRQVEESGNRSAIYHSIWDGSAWSRATAVLTSPNGEAEQPSVALTPSGNLLAVWSNGAVGEIYFSRVAAGQSGIASAWSEPVSLPTVRAAASAPQILVDRVGNFYVIYAISLNENRGIYIVSSEDRGASWSEPTLVFDAVAAGWDMVDQPKLYLSSQGNKHLLWLRRSLAAANGGNALLYYAYSQNGESSWTDPESVHSPSQQVSTVVWHQILGVGERIVHRSWQELANGRTSLWHQQSLDNGFNWTEPYRVDESAGTSSAGLTLNLSEEAILVDTRIETNDSNGVQSGSLDHWFFEDGRWQKQESLTLSTLPVLRNSNLAVATTTDGRLAVVYIGQSEEVVTPELLYFVQRELMVPEVSPTPLPSLTPTATPTGTPTPTATPEPLPELPFPVDPGVSGPSLPIIGTLSGNKIIIVGAILAAIPIGLVSVWVLIRRARINRY